MSGFSSSGQDSASVSGSEEASGASVSTSAGAGPSHRGIYYCHGCNQRISHISETFECVLCNSGFVEEVHDNDPPEGSEDDDDDNIDAANFSSPDAIARSLFRPSVRGMRFIRGRGRPSVQIVSPNVDPQMDNVHELFINDLLTNLFGMNRGAAHIQFFPAHLHGNPGDYAWGREGLDAIVTSLLNQMDGAGPPPLRREDINNIPIVKVTQEQVDLKVECSVCFDDFKLDESVRQLNCDHIFHESCIVPWLKLHGTCPVCRKQQENSSSSEASNRDGNESNEGAASTSSSAAEHSRMAAVMNIFDFPARFGSSLSSPSRPEEQPLDLTSPPRQENEENASNRSPRPDEFQDYDVE